MHEQVVEGQYELAGAFEYFSAGANEKVTHCGTLVDEFFLARKFLHLFGHEFEKKDDEAINLNLLHQLL